ncbi:MAG: zf-HC2 domain-containing protein [Gemmatimonadota bacterium]
MQHIPEDELHAYLDQALSRSQCVEIESHLAACPRCQAQRDGIAALRDRTTALLNVLAPPISLPPSFETIRNRAVGVQAVRQRTFRTGIWAASVVAAIGLGWMAHLWSGATTGGRAPGGITVGSRGPEAAAAQLPSDPDSTRSSSPQPMTPTGTLAQRQVAQPPVRHESPRLEVARPTVVDTPAFRQPMTPAPSPLAVDSRNHPSTDSSRFSQSNTAGLSQDRELSELEPESMWRLVSVAAGEKESGAPLPSVPGLPVMQVRIQSVQANQKIVAVDQQLATGEVIRTIEGPAAQMADLIARDGQRTQASDAATNAIDALMTIRFGDRIVAIRGPADSVRALMNRLAVPGKKP